MINHIATGALQGALVGCAAIVTMRAGVAVERRAAARRRAVWRKRMGRVTVRPDRAVTSRYHFAPRTWWS